MAERDAKGRFLKGNNVAKGHGRKSRVHEEKYLDRLRRVVTLAKWQEIIEAMIEHAKDGNVRAARFIADYVVGKPIIRERIEVVGIERIPMSEWEQIVIDRRAEVEAL